MEETENPPFAKAPEGKKKTRWQIILPVILAIIIVGIFIYLDYKNRPPKPTPPNNNQSVYKPKPISPSENPQRTEPLTPDQLIHYGCAGPDHLEAKTLKQPDSIWEVKKSGETTKVSLGKYKITASKDTIFDIKKLWLYFFSEKLGREEDKFYALESSYVSRMLLVVNDYEKEIKLGGDEYMLIELDYPLGDLYPYDKEAVLEYEFIIELKCKNIKNGECLDNNNQSLDYVNNATIISTIRLFALGCQEFDKDITIESKFKYGD